MSLCKNMCSIDNGLYQFIRGRMDVHKYQTLHEENRSLMYYEVLHLAESFGQRLRQMKIKKVGILCRSELNAGIGFLSCFSAGVTAVPLSHRYGRIHGDSIIEHMAVSHLVTDETGGLEIRQIAEAVPETEDLSDVAVILCTSGTTGVPKGAMITYANLITNLTDIECYFAVSDHDAILIARPIYHCAVLTGEFLISLCLGLRVVFYNREFNPVWITQAISAHQATVFCGTPTLMYHLCRTVRRERNTLALKVSAVSGECMSKPVAKSIRNTFPNLSIYSVYGLTEASPRVSALPPDEFDAYPLSVGYPLYSLQASISNGELLIRGKSVMKGYYRNPSMTADTLRDDWLHTGDAAKIDPDGRITILGRVDHLIIRAGMNIYPQEIENALKADPRITEILVFGECKAGVTQRLCVHAVANDLSKSELLSICRERLPVYAVPDTAEIVDAIPRNASGKIIRPKPDFMERMQV